MISVQKYKVKDSTLCLTHVTNQVIKLMLDNITAKLTNVGQSKTALDSAFQIVDSGFQILDSSL